MPRDAKVTARGQTDVLGADSRQTSGATYLYLEETSENELGGTQKGLIKHFQVPVEEEFGIEPAEGRIF